MTVAICIKCGAVKHGSWTPCSKCRHSPFGDVELAWAVTLSDHSLPRDELDRAGRFIAETGRLPEIDQSFLDRQVLAIKASAQSLSKIGIMPAPEADGARKSLMIASVEDTAAARFWRSIRLFDVRLYHPEASVPLTISAGTFRQTAIVMLSQSFAESLDCLRCLTDLKAEGYDTFYVALDAIDPQDVGIDVAEKHILDVRSEPGRQRFLDWLKALD